MIVVYKLTNTTTGEFYIGSTNDFDKRVRQHLYRLRNNKQANPKLQNSFNKYGESSFEFSVVEVLENTDHQLEREQYWLNTLKPTFNIIKNAGEIHYPTPTKEVGQKISAANTGKKRPLSAIIRTAEANRGRVASEETRRKISEARLGKGVKGINGKLVLDREMGIFYSTIQEAAVVVGYSFEHLGRMLSGKYSNTTSLVFV